MARGGKRAGAGRGKKNYDSYSKQYDEKKAQLAKKGFTMHQRKLSQVEFEAQYARMSNQRKAEVSKGQRKKTGNITRDLVDKQAFELTQKQAKALVKGHEKMGKPLNMTLQELRTGDYLRQEYDTKKTELEELEIDNVEEELAKYISTEFFGS